MRKILAGLLLFLTALTAQAQYIVATHGPVTYVGTPGVVPSQASSNGFNVVTFQTTTFSATNVDVVDGCRAAMDAATSTTIPCAKQWYPYRLSNANPLNSNGTNGSCLPNLVFVSGVMRLNGCRTGPNGQIAMAVPNAGQSTWHGLALGGAGAYVEATMKWPVGSYNNDCTALSTTATCGWVAFWGQPLEYSLLFNGVPGSARWALQGSSYALTLEDDFMEYQGTNAASRIGSALHLAYGVSNVGRANSAITRWNTTGLDTSTYHRYGWLWVAATATTSGGSYYYMDDTPMGGNQQWDQFVNSGAAPFIPANLGTSPYSCPSGTKCSPTWTFGMHDIYHYVVIFGTGIGGAQISGGGTGPNPFPFDISSVKIWQVDGSGNLSQ